MKFFMLMRPADDGCRSFSRAARVRNSEIAYGPEAYYALDMADSSKLVSADTPASGEATQVRYYIFGWVTAKSGQDVAAGNFFQVEKLADRRSAWPILIRMAREAGHEVADDATVTLPHFFSLPPIPRPPTDDLRPLVKWEVSLDFACDDVKFGSSAYGVFEWPEEPQGAVLEEMSIVLMSNVLAIRGDDPENANYSRIISREVRPCSSASTICR